MSVHITEAKYLLLEDSTTTLSPSISHMKSVNITEAKFLLLEVSTTTSSPSFWHMKSVHITEAKVLLLDITTITLNPSFLHHDVSIHDWGKVSSGRGQYYYIESQYLTHEVRTYPWGHVSTAKGQYNCIVSKYWHMKSVHFTETKVLLLDVSTTTLSPNIWHNDVSTHHWGQVSTARGQYYYIKSKYLTQLGQYTLLRQSFHRWRSVLLHRVPVSDAWNTYTPLRPSFYC